MSCRKIDEKVLRDTSRELIGTVGSHADEMAALIEEALQNPRSSAAVLYEAGARAAEKQHKVYGVK